MRARNATPAAVIGMTCRLPGGIDSPQRLWEALLWGEDFVGEIPADRLGAEHLVDAAPLRSRLGGNSLNATNGHGGLKGLTGVVVVTAPPDGESEESSTRRGREYLACLVDLARELAELPGEPPRLYLVTRHAASVRVGDPANLEQAGLRGLMLVINSEHPHLRATQIDVDEDTAAQQVALQLRSGSQEDETAVDHERDGMRLQIRTPGGLESLEIAAFGRYPTFEGYRQRLGIDFAGVVSAVGPDITDHRVYGVWNMHRATAGQPLDWFCRFSWAGPRAARAAGIESSPTETGRTTAWHPLKV